MCVCVCVCVCVCKRVSVAINFSSFEQYHSFKNIGKNLLSHVHIHKFISSHKAGKHRFFFFSSSDDAHIRKPRPHSEDEG